MTFRLRSTLWYVLSLGILLLVFSIQLYRVAEAALREELLEALERESILTLAAVRAEHALADGADVYFAVEENGSFAGASRGVRDIGMKLETAPGPSFQKAGNGVLVLRKRIPLGDGRHLHVARNATRYRVAVGSLLATLLIGMPCTLALAAFGGYRLTGRALAPVRTMADTARQISGEKLSGRIAVPAAPAEFATLATVLNEMLERIERAFEQQRRFTGDASHQLRTPLAAIRTVGETALRNGGTEEELREAVGSMLEEAARLSALSEQLLLLARADAGMLTIERTPLDLAALAREAVELLQVLAEERGMPMHLRVPPSAPIRGDAALLRQVLLNLLDNAIKYGTPGTPVEVDVESRAGAWVLRVTDRGPGVPEPSLPLVFDRFFRAAEGGGSGLGLPVAKWIAELHGGRIAAANRKPNGFAVELELPG